MSCLVVSCLSSSDYYNDMIEDVYSAMEMFSDGDGDQDVTHDATYMMCFCIRPGSSSLKTP